MTGSSIVSDSESSEVRGYRCFLRASGCNVVALMRRALQLVYTMYVRREGRFEDDEQSEIQILITLNCTRLS